jgi:uncharacterized protein YjbJ (UPF0337 family)
MAGTGDKLKGKANEAAGKVTGDKKQELKGKLQQTKGSAKNAIGAEKEEMDRKTKNS